MKSLIQNKYFEVAANVGDLHIAFRRFTILNNFAIVVLVQPFNIDRSVAYLLFCLRVFVAKFTRRFVCILFYFLNQAWSLL